MKNPSTTLAEQRQREAADPAASVWVSASAGTGKTKVLTDRVLSLMLAGTPPQRMLCLTFTRAAAAEMATRIADVLGRWAMLAAPELEQQVASLMGAPPDDEMLRRARRLFAEVLDTPGGMNIETIHAFCQSLLRRFPLEAGIAPHFSLMEERDAEELLVSAREEILTRARNAGQSPLADALAVVTAQIHEATFTDLLQDLTASRGRLQRLIAGAGGIEKLIERVYGGLGVAAGTTGEAIIREASQSEAFDELGLRLAIDALAAGSSTDQERGTAVQSWLIADSNRVDQFDAYLRVYLTQSYQAGPIQIRKTLITKKAAAAAPGVEEILAEEADRLIRTLMQVRKASVAESTAALLRFGDALLTAYQARKLRHALFDYDDLILEAGNLLQAEGAAPWVLFKLDGGIDHILIDEAQDTSPEQWQVVQALTGEYFAGRGTSDVPRTVFAVGDVKQSIYSFQGADPRAFGEMRERFGALVPAGEQKWREVDLNISFRSTQPILAAVDAVFSPAEVRDGVSLDGEVIHHDVNRINDGGLVEIWPAVAPKPLDAATPWKPPVERVTGDSAAARLARLVAKRIHRMIMAPEILESKNRPIEAGDIMILVRRRVGFVEELVRSLKTLDIDVAGVDRLVLIEHLAVMDLVALGRFLLLPEDDLNLATVLKGPLLGLDEDQLFRLANGRTDSLWRALRAQARAAPHFAAAHRFLSDLLSQADYVPPFELFAKILGAGRGREKLLSRLGPEAADPIGEFLSLALRFERTHAPSLEGFLYWLEAGAVEVKRDLDQGTQNAVRVMTVHGAKGLQAPIVFLPDTMQVPMQGPRLLWMQEADGVDEGLLWAPRRGVYDDVCESLRTAYDRERDREYRRLLYVAMTRAEDRLYVCGWESSQQPPLHCWYKLIEAGMAKAGGVETDEFLAQAEEIDDAEVCRIRSDQTGEPENKGDTATAAAAKLPAWAIAPAPAEVLPPKPLAPSRPLGEEPPVISPLAAPDAQRFQRGRLIHALLQTLPGLPDQQKPRVAQTYLAQAGHGLARAQQKDIADEVLAILAAPEFKPLFGPNSQAEVPIVGHVGATIVSGQLDRLVAEDDGILIVDYKTNRDAPAAAAEVPGVYLRQLAAYRAVLGQIYPDRPVRCALLWTLEPKLMPIDAALLDAVAP